MKDEEKYLEDEMEKFGERWPYPSSFDGYDKNWVDELTEECAKHFYELGKKDMKEQMMKDAVEGEISSVDVGDDSYVKKLKVPGLQEAIRKFNVCDKVRIIIVKED